MTPNPSQAEARTARTSRASPRRAPTAENRLRDAERSRRKLLAAALDEFAAKGYAATRVQDIAERAGVNKQLVNYYFGGKEGLYRELQGQWEAREASFAGPEVPLETLAGEYVHAALSDPRLTRLLVWAGLSEEPGEPGQRPGTGAADPDVEDLRRRQAAGELADDLDPGCTLLAMFGAIAAPIVLPQIARKACGLDPGSAEFEARYAEHIKRMVRRLGGRPGA